MEATFSVDNGSGLEANGNMLLSNIATSSTYSSEFNFIGNNVSAVVSYEDENNYYEINLNNDVLSFNKIKNGNKSLIQEVTFNKDYNYEALHTLRIAHKDGKVIIYFDNLNKIVSNDWPIYTKTHDTPPAKYLEKAWVRNSFVSNGAIIDGKVENSVICRDVVIKENAVIRNSILLSGSEVAKDAVLEYVIVDKGAKIVNVKELKGTKENPLYVGQGDII
jgi:hypothetical protein